MTVKFSFSLEHTDRPGVVRGFVWKTGDNTGYRPVTVVHDIAEGDADSVRQWLVDFYSDVTLVRLSDGELEEPDCLTLWEAAEAAMPYRAASQ